MLLSANLRWRWQFSKIRWCHCKSNCAPNKVSGKKCDMNRVSHCFSNFNAGISPSWVLTWIIIAPLVFQSFLVNQALRSLVSWTVAWYFLFSTTIIWDIIFFHGGNQYNLCFCFGFRKIFELGGEFDVNRLIQNSQAVRSKVFYTSTLIWHIFWKCWVSLLGFRCNMFWQDNLTS